MTARTIPHYGRLRNFELGVLPSRDRVDMVRQHILDSLQSVTLLLRQSIADGQSSASNAKGWQSVKLFWPRTSDEVERCEELDMFGILFVACPGQYEHDPINDLMDKLRGVRTSGGITFRVEPPSKLTSPTDCFVIDCAADPDKLGFHASGIR